MEPSETVRVNTKEEGFQASSSLILPSPMFEVLGLAFTDLPMATCCLVSASLKPRRKNSWPSPSPQPFLCFSHLQIQCTLKFGCCLEWILALFDYISSTFLILKQLLSWDSFFTSWKLSWVRPCQEGILLIVLVKRVRPLLNGANLLNCCHLQVITLAVTLSSLVHVFSPKCTFFISFCLIHFFHCISLHKNCK